MQALINILKGVIIGGSMSAPGVSGGTMAILLNCYHDLIRAVSSFTKNIRKNFIFLFQIALGGGIGMLLISKLIEAGLKHELIGHPLQCLFIGFVLGGLPVMFKMTKTAKNKSHITDYAFAVLGFAIVLLLRMLPENILNLTDTTGLQSYGLLGLAGFIVAFGLVLPGISTMGMLAALGIYETVNSAISQLDLSILIPLGIGGIVGVFSTTKTIEKLMDKHPRKLLLLIIGFVLGSVMQILPNRMPKGLEIIYWGLSAVLGFILITLISLAEKTAKVKS